MAERSTSRRASQLSQIDPEAILRLGSLELRARTIVEGFTSGLHRSPYHGFSAEFSEYRPYSLGDDLRYLDWRLLARTDRWYVKRFEDETNVRCHILVDLSRSMGYGADRPAKSEYAITLAATLAHFLSKQRDAVGLVTFDEDVVDVVPPRYRPGHLQHLITALERSTGGTSTGLALSLERVASLVKKRGIVVLISDLLAPLDGLDTSLGQLRARGHEVLVFRVLDPTEVDFDFDRPSQFEDMESGRTFYVDPARARDEYRQGFDEHRSGIERLCREHGVDFVQWRTDGLLTDLLFEYLQARKRRGRSVLRRPHAGGKR